MDFSPETIRARFHELTTAREAIDAELNPLRAELDGIVAGDVEMTLAQAQAREGDVREQIKALQSALYPVEMERALCARALGGKTGSPE